MDRFIAGARVHCTNAVHGCDVLVPYYDEDEHNNICAYSPVECVQSNCVFSAPIQALRSHLSIQHGWPEVRVVDYGYEHSMFVPPVESKIVITIDSDRGSLFVLRVRRRGATFALSLTGLCPLAEPGTYFICTMKVTRQGISMDNVPINRCVIMETDVPTGPIQEQVMWLPVSPEMLDGPNREMKLRFRINRVQHTSSQSAATV